MNLAQAGTLLENLNINELEQFNARIKALNDQALVARGVHESNLKSYDTAVANYEQNYGVRIDDTNLLKEIELEVSLLNHQKAILEQKVVAIEQGTYEREVISLINEENASKVGADGLMTKEALDQQEIYYKQMFDERAKALNITAIQENATQEALQQTAETIPSTTAQPTQQVETPVAQQPTMTEQPVNVQQPVQNAPTQPVQPDLGQYQNTVPQQPMVEQPVTYQQPVTQQPVIPQQPVVVQPQQTVPQQPAVDYASLQNQLQGQVNQTYAEEQQTAQQSLVGQPTQPNVQQQPTAPAMHPNLNWGQPQAVPQQPVVNPQEVQVQQNVNNHFSNLVQGTEFK